MEKIGNKTIRNSQLNKRHVKIPNIWIFGKDCTYNLQQLNFLLMFKEYDTIGKFSLCSEKFNPSMKYKGKFIQNMGY